MLPQVDPYFFLKTLNLMDAKIDRITKTLNIMDANFSGFTVHVHTSLKHNGSMHNSNFWKPLISGYFYNVSRSCAFNVVRGDGSVVVWAVLQYQ